ncbi:MAG: sugar phosphate isomerase/epimerase [Phycisphaerales bacterium]|nr:sugar phosphate isomerase/epimerase [Phycisphaerales bacterium]
MKSPQLSVCVDDLQLEIKASLHHARDLGFRAVDVKATAGPISPAELTGTGRRHLLRHLSDLGLRLGSLRGPADATGYGDGASGERRLEVMRRIIELSSALRVPVVSTSLGRLGEDESETTRIYGALEILAADADRLGVNVAIETAGVGVAELSDMLRKLNCPSISACCDSGAMLMRGEDPHLVGDVLAGRVHLVRARDAVAGSASAAGYEVPQGEGHLQLAPFLGGLAEAGFQQDIVLSRTSGSSRAADLLMAKKQFEELIA